MGIVAFSNNVRHFVFNVSAIIVGENFTVHGTALNWYENGMFTVYP